MFELGTCVIELAPDGFVVVVIGEFVLAGLVAIDERSVLAGCVVAVEKVDPGI
jgi:hypothetical protein